MEPRDAPLEAAATAYVDAVSKLEPLLKEADDYYTAENYKDDKMAKGKELHPRLVAAWDAFAGADHNLREAVEVINDRRALEKLAAIEQSEGRKVHYYVEVLMIHAKHVLLAEKAATPDVAAITQGLNDYEEAIKGAEQASGAGGDAKIGSFFMSNAKSYLVTGKQLMRRIRDHDVLQRRRPDDYEFRQRLDGGRIAAAFAARLQSAGRRLQSRSWNLRSKINPGDRPRRGLYLAVI